MREIPMGFVQHCTRVLHLDTLQKKTIVKRKSCGGSDMNEKMFEIFDIVI